jgi:hypothetical protein
MKRIIFIAQISMLLLNAGCKKCYVCNNTCEIQISTEQSICTTDFLSRTEYNNCIDSLIKKNDIKVKGGLLDPNTISYSGCGDEFYSANSNQVGIYCKEQ